jgi:uncharacterized membrane protein YfcA
VHVDLGIAAAGLGVGFVVGLTGMGGGALMTPLLVLLFKVQPLAAVSSDLVASFVMKPIGAGVHLKRGTVNLQLVKWLVLGSVPTAFCGALILDHLGDGDVVQDRTKLLLGVALLLAASSMVLRRWINRGRVDVRGDDARLTIKPLPTFLIGLAGGLIVGLSSVGSGSLMIVMLLALYPTLSASELVGTDLVQAIPLVGAAAFGHLLFGDFRLGLTGSLLVGAVPGVYVGARVSSRAPDRLIRPALIVVLAASGLKLLNAPNVVVGGFLVLAAVVVGVSAYRRRSSVATVAAGASPASTSGNGRA